MKAQTVFNIWTGETDSLLHIAYFFVEVIHRRVQTIFVNFGDAGDDGKKLMLLKISAEKN